MKRMYQKIKLIEFGSRHLIHVENDQKEKRIWLRFIGRAKGQREKINSIIEKIYGRGRGKGKVRKDEEKKRTAAVHIDPLRIGTQAFAFSIQTPDYVALCYIASM